MREGSFESSDKFFQMEELRIIEDETVVSLKNLFELASIHPRYEEKISENETQDSKPFFIRLDDKVGNNEFILRVILSPFEQNHRLLELSLNKIDGKYKGEIFYSPIVDVEFTDGNVYHVDFYNEDPLEVANIVKQFEKECSLS